MLSRIAESLFWIGRYVARSDGTSRILDVHLQMLLEDPWLEEDRACRALLSVMGATAKTAEPLNADDVLTLLATDRTNPSSVAFSISSARENARRAREVLSTELWECLNTTNARMPRKIDQTKSHDFFSWVRERAALATGVMEGNVSRDDAWVFYTLGRSLETADMTARLLATRALTEVSGPSWTTILRSCGGYEAYLRTYRGTPSASRAAEFLLMDRLFPRSVVRSITVAEECLRQLDPGNDRVGVSDPVRRALGRLRGQLEYGSVSGIIDQLPDEMENVQRFTSIASEGIRQRYFPTNPIPNWVGEAS